MKHYVVTLDNGHWPLTYKTTMAADAYDCIVSLLQIRCATLTELKGKFIRAIADLMDGEINSFETCGVQVQIRDGEV